MKQVLCWLVCCFIAVSAVAQTRALPLCTDKTVSLIFPFPVTYVDRGSANVLVQQVPGTETILFVKAAAKAFPETNLSVITGDGSVYTFDVCFDPAPLTWTYELPAQTKASTAAYAKSLLDNPPTVGGIRSEKGGVEASVSGIYVKNDALFLQLEIVNKTVIDYTVDYLRVYLRDQKSSKRTAVQEIELAPIYVAGNAKGAKANSATTVVLALQAFLIPDRKRFVMEVGERDGGRHLLLSLGNKHLLKAVTLPDRQ